VGSVTLANPVMTASGTAGYGTELARYLDLSALGAVVVKSLAAYEWAGNPAPRLHPTPQGMLNAVGLQGPGIPYWLEHVLPDLLRARATVVASIWGRSVDDYARAAELLSAAPPEVVAVEVNLSCPNLEGGRHLFAQSAADTGAAVEAARACHRPLWAKLTATVADLAGIARAATAAGAEAVTLINTVPGMAIDVETRSRRLGAGSGGLSGPAIHPVAVRAVHDVHAALPDVPIVGVGGVVTGGDAVELMMAGASAVQVGTATFADPRAPWQVLDEFERWCATHGVTDVRELIGAIHER
jgi:dihydroorotate dehydrogenase (NAD+) catalytic subunit